MITQILDKIDWPTDTLLLDFETYFDADYHLGKGKKALSIVEYVTDPRFAFIGLGIQFNDNEPRFIPGPYVPYMITRLKEKFGKALHNCTVVAKNNKFDCLILVEKFGIYPPYTIDVEDLSRYFDSRMNQKLSDLCKLFKLPAKGDTKQFKGLYWETMTPKQHQAMKEYCLGDIKNEKSLLEILLPMLDNPGVELDLAQHTLNLYLKPVLNLDIQQATQIASDMDSALSKDLSKVPWVLKYRTKAKPNIPKIMRAKKIFPRILQDVLNKYMLKCPHCQHIFTPDLKKYDPPHCPNCDYYADPDHNYPDFLPAEQVPMKQGKNQMIPATAQNDVAFQYLLAHKDQKVRELCRAKAACSSWPLHQSKVHRMVAQAKCSDGLIRMPLKYYGAHCVSPDTEVLTPYGWKQICDWSPDIPIMQWDVNGDLSWCRARKHESNQVPELYYMNAPRAKGAFSAGHKLGYFTHRDKLHIIEVGNAANKRLDKLPLSGFYNGGGNIMSDQMRVLVMVQADGHWKLTKTKGNYLVFGFRKEYKINRCKQLLNAVSIPYKIRPEKSGTIRIVCRVVDLPEWLIPERKVFGSWLLDSTFPARVSFFDELYWWDGWLEKNSAGFGYSSTVKQNADWVQILGHLTNKAVSVKRIDLSSKGWNDSYRCFISEIITACVQPKHWSIESYKGKVYCPTTSSGFWLMRYNNRVCVSKNTGRWSGTGGWNPMNLGGRGRNRPVHPLIAQVRSTLMAPDGYTLIIVDSAQIEARELAWVAHQDDLLKGFADGEDVYSEFATEVFQAKVWKPTEEEKKTPEGQTAVIRRGFGKDNILGDGFGMGANTLYDNCRQNDSLRPLFDSGEYDWDFCNRLIKAYRTKYSKIPEFWTEIAKCFRWPTKYPKERTVYKISETAELIFTRSGSTTKMQLPSGRVMNYRFASVSPKDDSIKYLHGHLWGGSITENLIQAMCRCLLGYWLLRCEDAGIPIVLHSYDELVGCVPEENAEKDLQIMSDIMLQGPAWAKGLPLGIDAKISKRFCK